MPCGDDHGYGETDRHVLEAEPTLCLLMRHLEKCPCSLRFPKRVLVWWEEHKRRDRKREAAELKNEKLAKKQAQAKIKELKLQYDL